MTTPRDSSQRLIDLWRVLTESPSRPTNNSTESSAAWEAHVGRMRVLTSTLQSDTAADNDQVDAIMMRVLLNDFAVSVAYLRRLAREAEVSISAAALPLKEVNRRIDRREQLNLKKLSVLARR